jgi:hypothetical protein
VQAVVPLLLALLASAAQVQAARDSDSQQQRRHSEGTELQPLASEQQLWQRQQLRASRLASSSLASIAVAMALMAAAIAQPSVLAAPYMLSAAVAVWRWSGGSSRLSHGSSRGSNGHRALLQTYTAAYLVALYAWQAVLHGWDVLQPIAAVLGLFTLSSESDEKGWNGLVPALVQLAALLLLYLALGAEQPRARHLGHGQAFGSEGGRDERSPLLSGRQQPQASQLAAEPVAATSWVQLLYLLLLEAVELVCSRPAAVAAVLAAVSLLRPSLLGGCVLLIGLVSLMGGWADAAVRRMRRPLAALLLVWQLAWYALLCLLCQPCTCAMLWPFACLRAARQLTRHAALCLPCCCSYGATVAGRVVDVPQAADAVGVHDFGSSAWLPLLAMLLAAAATAGPATPARAGGSPLSSSNLLRLQQQQQQQQQGVSPRLQSLLFRIGSLRQPHAGTGAHSAGSPSDPGSPAAAAGAAASDGTLDAAAAAPWLVAWNLLLRLLYFCGFLAVPAALFVVGCTRYDALHGIYLAGLLCWLAGNTLHLKPGLAAVSQALACFRHCGTTCSFFSCSFFLTMCLRIFKSCKVGAACKVLPLPPDCPPSLFLIAGSLQRQQPLDAAQLLQHAHGCAVRGVRWRPARLWVPAPAQGVAGPADGNRGVAAGSGGNNAAGAGPAAAGASCQPAFDLGNDSQQGMGSGGDNS